MNFKLNISYDGTDFSGWQIQPNVRTVQNDLQNALQEIFRNKGIKLLGSGRTDSGVHAVCQVANFSVDTTMSPIQIKNAINSNIKNDIYINNCKIVDDNFNSRFSAIEREYIYKISKQFNPLFRKYYWYVSYNLDLKKLDRCAEIISGEHNFELFCKSLSKKEDNHCTIKASKWTFEKDIFFYKISANRFLHHMVRMLVGTMIEVAKDNISIDQFKKMINVEIMKAKIINSPPHGLYLNKVIY